MRETLQIIELVLGIIVVIVVLSIEVSNSFKSKEEDEPIDAQLLIKFIFKPTAFGIMTILVFKLISLLF